MPKKSARAPMVRRLTLYPAMMYATLARHAKRRGWSVQRWVRAAVREKLEREGTTL